MKSFLCMLKRQAKPQEGSDLLKTPQFYWLFQWACVCNEKVSFWFVLESIWVAIKTMPVRKTSHMFSKQEKGKQNLQRGLVCEFAENSLGLLTFLLSLCMEWESKFLVRAQECLGSNKDNASSNHSSHGWSLKYPFPKRMWRTINEDMCHCAEKTGNYM